MFVDELKIYTKAGDGGGGIVSWRRFKYIPLGGPAGGDGGKGGDFYLEGVRDLTRLSNYVSKPRFLAENGSPGRRHSRGGKKGEDFFLKVPIGSIVKNLETEETFSIEKDGQRIKILSGGRGGFGNEHFKSSRNVSPTEHTEGRKGEEGTFEIKLELIAEVGLVGLPSAGKSTLLNVLTQAKARVGDYPFTTLEPNLGDFYGFTIADIPGLIEGASLGKGLGHKFLKHIKKVKIILHLVSLEYADPKKEYEKIRQELGNFEKKLLEKEEIILLSKSDLVSPGEGAKVKKSFEKKYHKPTFLFSILDDPKVEELKKILTDKLK